MKIQLSNARMMKRLSSDPAAIAFLLLLHPIVYLVNQTRGYFSPDAQTYMAFARDYLSHGLLYFETGLNGEGLVLSPLYPFLMLIGNALSENMNMYAVAELVSNCASFGSSIVFFLVLRHWCTRFYAVVGVVLIQVNYEFIVIGVSPLTEALFVFVMASVIWLVFNLSSSRQTILKIMLLGILLALAFLTRHIGLILAPFILLVVFLIAPRGFIRNAAALAVGMLLVLSPYAIALERQGGVLGADLSVFEQRWSKRDVVSIDDLDISLQQDIRELQARKTENYNELLVKRRLLRQLLPDSSAMLSHVELEPNNSQYRGIGRVIDQVWSSLPKFGERLTKNYGYMVEFLGPIALTAFLISMITPLLDRNRKKPILSRYLVSGLVIYYVCSLSLLTGSIGRYVAVLVPFILLSIVIEAYLLLGFIRQKATWTLWSPGVFTVALAALALSQPKYITEIKFYKKSAYQDWLEEDFGRVKQTLKSSDLVFATNSLPVVFAGAGFRIMPNDSLEKIRLFALQEGVEWLLVTQAGSKETLMYTKARNWYMDPNLSQHYGRLVDLRAASDDGSTMLFKFITDRD